MKLHIRKPKGLYQTQQRTYCGKVIDDRIAEYAAGEAFASLATCKVCVRVFEEDGHK